MGSEAQRRVLANAGDREPRPGEFRRFRVLDRRNRAATAEPTPVEIIVSAACPKCGRARGDSDQSMRVFDVWTRTEHSISVIRNPCGHVDLHEQLLAEAERFRLEQSA